MVAGFLAGYLETGDYERAFYMGVCTGSASAFSEGLAQKEDVYALLDQGKEPELLEQYRERLCCIDRPVTVISPAGRYEAECVGLDENAHLLVKTADGQVNALSSGEISIRL